MKTKQRKLKSTGVEICLNCRKINHKKSEMCHSVTINCVTQLNERESLQQRSSCISSVRGFLYETINYTKLIVNMI